MTIYVLHFDPPFHHAKHYVGFTPDADPARRVQEHLRCTQKGSPLVRAAIQAGCEVSLAAVIEGCRNTERKLKNRKKTSAFCPLCKGEPGHVRAH